MKYTIQTINTDNKFLFFWGHQPSKDGAITKTCFSQWWKSAFKVKGIEYKTAEHWMMAKKAELFGDKEILDKIHDKGYHQLYIDGGKTIQIFLEEDLIDKHNKNMFSSGHIDFYNKFNKEFNKEKE